MRYDEMYHHGIKGMRWGIRRFQNPDGSLTARGKSRRSSSDSNDERVAAKKAAKQQRKDEKVARKAAAKQQKEAEKELQKEEARYANKPVKDMTDEELLERTTRLEAERRYLQAKQQVSALEPKKVSGGKEFAKHVGNNVIKPAVTEAGKKYLTEYLNQQVKKQLGVKPSEMETLKKEVDKLKLKKNKAELEDYFEKRKSGSDSDDDDDGTLTKRERRDIEDYLEKLLEERENS